MRDGEARESGRKSITRHMKHSTMRQKYNKKTVKDDKESEEKHQKDGEKDGRMTTNRRQNDNRRDVKETRKKSLKVT